MWYVRVVDPTEAPGDSGPEYDLPASIDDMDAILETMAEPAPPEVVLPEVEGAPPAVEEPPPATGPDPMIAQLVESQRQQAEAMQGLLQQMAQVQAQPQAQPQGPQHITDEQITGMMQQAGYDPTHPLDVMRFRDIIESRRMQADMRSQITALQQQQQDLQERAQYFATESRLKGAVGQRLAGFGEVPAATAEAIQRTAAMYASQGYSDEQALAAAVQPFQPLLEQIQQVRAAQPAPSRFAPRVNHAGVQAAAIQGRASSGRTKKYTVKDIDAVENLFSRS